MTKQKEESVKIITPEFRASYPSVFQARKVNQNDPNEKAKFSIQMIFRVTKTPESEQRGEKVVDLAPLKQEVVKILLKHLGAEWQEKLKERKGDGSPVYRVPFRDGNAVEKRDADGYGPGTIFITASTEYKPGVVDANKTEILNPQDFYGGCYARAQIHPYWYPSDQSKFKGNQGVTFGLDNVQKIRDGEPFSGRMKAEDAFDAIEQPGGPVGAAVGVGGANTGDPLTGL